jgi:hypothetical protein
MSGAVEIAKAAWGDAIPDWVLVLAQCCALRSQNAVAREMKISAAAISTVLRAKYGADTGRIEARVRGLYMGGKVACPGLGTIGTHECRDWQDKARDFAMGNPTRTRMYRACRSCPRFTGEDVATEAATSGREDAA